MRAFRPSRYLPFLSLLCLFAWLLLAGSCVSSAAADLSQDQTEAVAEKARAVLEPMRFGFIDGTLIFHPQSLQRGRPCPHWSLYRASSSDRTTAGVSWSMSVRVFLSPETANIWFGETLASLYGPGTTYEKFMTTADGAAYVGLNRAEGYRPNVWLRCGNIVLGIGWRQQSVPDPLTEAYKQEGFAAVRAGATQIHDAFAAAGICGGAGEAGDKPTVVPPGRTENRPDTPPDKPGVTPPDKPKDDEEFPAHGDPQVRVELDTMRYTPNEVLMGTVEARTGLAEGERGSGQLTWSIFRDTTGADLLGMFARAGAPPARRSTTPAEEVLSGSIAQPVTKPLTTLRLAEVLVAAPAELGEYVVVIKLTMNDGQKTSASAPFDVLDNPRRLIVGKISPDTAVVGRACTISLPFLVSGQDAPGAPTAVVRASGDIFGLTDQAKGVRETLAEQQPSLTPFRNMLQGKASWEVIFPKPGIYLISCQAIAPYYGAREQSTAILVQGGGNVTDAGGGRADANGGAGETTTTTIGGGNTPGGKPAISDQTLIPSVGMDIGVKNGNIVILAVAPDSQAELAGIMVGDQITAIDDKPVRGMTPGQIQQMLTPQGAEAVVFLDLTATDGTKTKVHIVAERK